MSQNPRPLASSSLIDSLHFPIVEHIKKWRGHQKSVFTGLPRGTCRKQISRRFIGMNLLKRHYEKREETR